MNNKGLRKRSQTLLLLRALFIFLAGGSAQQPYEYLGGGETIKRMEGPTELDGLDMSYPDIGWDFHKSLELVTQFPLKISGSWAHNSFRHF